jgi:transcriptional regulator GlxA family with amidase domain
MDYRVPKPAFELTIIGLSDVISTSAAVKIIPDVSIASARSKLDEFDILVVPGGPPPIVFSLVENNSEVLQIVRDFGNLPSKDTERPRTILSICTGALFLGASGLLNGLRATTHHLFLDDLKAICGKEGETQVVQARYVDGGLRENGLRVITGGGVSSGLDSACYFVSQSFSPEMASFAAKMSEFSWIPQ